VWAVARIPAPEQEDDRLLQFELERLRQGRSAHTNRIRSLLVLHNLRVRYVGGRIWTHWWARQRELLAPGLRVEIDCECERLPLGAPADPPARSTTGAIGAGSAWTLVRELFGWRQFRNRRELAGCLGLTPTPYASGTSDVELGISKAGNRRCRWLMAELAWSWLSPAASSAIERFAGTGKGLRRIGIVAFARRLAIVLWRFLEHGEIPAGAIPKSREINMASS
jgi:transposase